MPSLVHACSSARSGWGDGVTVTCLRPFRSLLDLVLDPRAFSEARVPRAAVRSRSHLTRAVRLSRSPGCVLEGKGVLGDVATRTADPSGGNWSRRRAVVGVPLPGGRSRLEAGAAWRVCFGAGRGGGFGTGAGAVATGAANLSIADRRRAGGGVPRAA